MPKRKHTKLTDEQIQEIRTIYHWSKRNNLKDREDKKFTQTYLAEDYETNRREIGAICLGHKSLAEYKRKYKQTPEAKAKERKYDRKRKRTPEYEANQKEYQRKYGQTPEGKARQRKYKQTPEAKAKEREYDRKRSQTPERKEKQREYDRKRRQTKKGKINRRISAGIRQSLKNKSKSKDSYHWEELVDFTYNTLYKHLEKMVEKVPNATMDDFLEARLELDHIVPIASYEFDTFENPEFKQCWSLDNFQLLWATDNHSKKDKWDGTPNNESFNLNLVSYDELRGNLATFGNDLGSKLVEAPERCAAGN